MNMREQALAAYEAERAQRERDERQRLVELSVQTFDKFNKDFPGFKGKEVNGRLVTVGDVVLWRHRDGGYWVLVQNCPDCGEAVFGSDPIYNLASLGEKLSKPWPTGFLHNCPAKIEPPRSIEERVADALETIAAHSIYG